MLQKYKNRKHIELNVYGNKTNNEMQKKILEK